MDDRDVLLSHINSSLNNKEITEVIHSWNSQQQCLQYELKSFWSNNEGQFRFWWDHVGEDVRKAMVITALEDLPNEGITTLVDFLCPDLVDIDCLVADGGKKIPILIEQALKEHSDNTTEQKTTFMSVLQDIQLQHPLFAINSLLVLQSCIYLHFLNDIIIIYEGQKVGA